MDKVYSDQIWLYSHCGEVENQTRILLNETAKKKIKVCLVDSVYPELLAESDTIVTDNFFPGQKWALWPEYYGSFCYQPRFTERPPTALFACFINRACPFRQSWLYQFLRRGIFEQGLISYRLDYRDTDWPSPMTDIDRRDLFNEMFDRGNAEFHAEHEILRMKMPLRTFDVELEQAVIDSKISIIIETYFEHTGILSFSEKTFRNLLLPRPWMLFAAPNSVAHLRQVGFDVMDYIIDHGYDSILDPIERQIAILDRLQQWTAREIDTDQIRYMTQTCRNNYLLLQSLRHALPKKIQEIMNGINHGLH